MVKNPPTNARGAGSDPWVGKNPWRRKWQPTPVFLRGKCQVGYNPGGPKESDTTEHTRVRVKRALSIFHSAWLQCEPSSTMTTEGGILAEYFFFF